MVNDASLADYKNIYSKFCFLDETGSLEDPQNPFFTVGILICSQPYYLASKIGYERNQRHIYQEMKFNKVSRVTLDFAKFMIDTYFEARSVSFYSYTLDKEAPYFRSQFNGDIWEAYKQITKRVLEAAYSPNQIFMVIADHVTTPKDIRYEVGVKHELNKHFKKFVVAGVCRIDSKANDLLQLTDLMIGAINFDLKLQTGVIKAGSKYKRQLSEHLKEKFGAKNFSNGFRIYNSQIFVDKDHKFRFDGQSET